MLSRRSLLALSACCALASAATARSGDAPEFTPFDFPKASPDVPVAAPLALARLAGGTAAAAPVPGAVTLLHVFATWCAPCREELASLETLRRQMAGQPLRIMAISAGEPPVRVRRFFEANPVGFEVLLDEDRQVLARWSVVTLPTTFLIGPDGSRGLKVEGDVEWTAPGNLRQLETLFKPASAAVGRRS